MLILQRTLFLFVSLMFITACEVTPPDDNGKNDGYKLGNSNVVITRDLSDPQFNVLNYAQSESPHKLIEKDFRFTGVNRGNYKVDQQSFSPTNCTSGGTDYSLFILNGDKVGKIEPSQDFTASKDDVLKVSVSNTGGCQNINYKFSVLPVGN